MSMATDTNSREKEEQKIKADTEQRAKEEAVKESQRNEIRSNIASHEVEISNYKKVKLKVERALEELEYLLSNRLNAYQWIEDALSARKVKVTNIRSVMHKVKVAGTYQEHMSETLTGREIQVKLEAIENTITAIKKEIRNKENEIEELSRKIVSLEAIIDSSWNTYFSI